MNFPLQNGKCMQNIIKFYKNQFTYFVSYSLQCMFTFSLSSSVSRPLLWNDCLKLTPTKCWRRPFYRLALCSRYFHIVYLLPCIAPCMLSEFQEYIWKGRGFQNEKVCLVFKTGHVFEEEYFRESVSTILKLVLAIQSDTLVRVV